MSAPENSLKAHLLFDTLKLKMYAAKPRVRYCQDAQRHWRLEMRICCSSDICIELDAPPSMRLAINQIVAGCSLVQKGLSRRPIRKAKLKYAKTCCGELWARHHAMHGIAGNVKSLVADTHGQLGSFYGYFCGMARQFHVTSEPQPKGQRHI